MNKQEISERLCYDINMPICKNVPRRSSWRINMNIYDKDGWLFENPMENRINVIDDKGIEELLKLAQIEDEWVGRVRNEVLYRDQHPNEKSDYIIDELRILNTAGTVFKYPFNISTITFPSRRHLFRGEPQIYERSVPSLNRKLYGKTKYEKMMWKALADLRIYQFLKFIWKINVVPYWEAKLSDINIKALAQHYGFDTHLLDLTNDVRTALFFATCKYVPATDSYRPMTRDDIDTNEKKYGVLFHTPDWRVDYFQPVGTMTLFSDMNFNKEISLDTGDCDGLAFQIGMQPLMRCHHQSGYIYPMKTDAPLQENWNFEKIHFLQSPELSQRIFDMMDGGKKVFPYEGISEAKAILDLLKCSFTFSEDDILCVYDFEHIDKKKFLTVNDFADNLRSFNYNGHHIQIQNQEVEYPITQKLLDRINSHYDGKDLLAPTGGMIHYKPEEKRYRDQRCVEIYGRLI